jgi:WD40 repeat protein
MKRLIFPCCLWTLALFSVGCNPTESTSPPTTETAPADETRQLAFHGSDATYSIEFGPDGKTLAVADEGQLILWDVRSQVATRLSSDGRSSNLANERGYP